jgi:hypothetical protein
MSPYTIVDVVCLIGTYFTISRLIDLAIHLSEVWHEEVMAMIEQKCASQDKTK